ncbi:MAG: MFS transporter [Thermodesulfobacteriota bacterium]|jgi:MFS family permease
MAHGGKVFYGWWIVLVAGVGLFMGYGPIVSFTFGVFLKPLGAEFGWSRAEISLAFSLSLLVMSGAFPLVGRLVDRFGARTVIVPSVLCFGLGLTSFALLSGPLWQFYLLYLALGVVGGGTAPVPYSSVISHWFDKRRGLALGVAMVGLGLGAFLMPSVAQTLIAAVGWRAAYVIIGVTVMAVAIPVVGLFLIETPQMLGLTPDGEGHHDAAGGGRTAPEGLSFREARRTGTFWLMVVAFFLMSASVHACLIHLVPLLTDRGLSPQSAALATSLLGGALLLGRVGAGYLLDRFFAAAVAVCFFGGTAVGLLLLWGEVTGGLAFVAAFLVGLGLGAEGDIIAYLISRYFGLRAFGEIYGYAFASFTLGGVVGPLLMGIGFDSTGSYTVMLSLFVLATLIAAGLMARLGPYRLWERMPMPVRAGTAP